MLTAPLTNMTYLVIWKYSIHLHFLAYDLISLGLDLHPAPSFRTQIRVTSSYCETPDQLEAVNLEDQLSDGLGGDDR